MLCCYASTRASSGHPGTSVPSVPLRRFLVHCSGTLSQSLSTSLVHHTRRNVKRLISRLLQPLETVFAVQSFVQHGPAFVENPRRVKQPRCMLMKRIRGCSRSLYIGHKWRLWDMPFRFTPSILGGKQKEAILAKCACRCGVPL